MIYKMIIKITNIMTKNIFFFFVEISQEVDKEPNANRTFSIDTRGGKGVISLIAPLDYERKHLYQLRVIASVSI